MHTTSIDIKEGPYKCIFIFILNSNINYFQSGEDLICDIDIEANEYTNPSCLLNMTPKRYKYMYPGTS